MAQEERSDLTLFVDWYSVWTGGMGPGPDGEAVLMDAPRGVRLAVQPAELTDVVLRAEHPWESGLGYATVLKTDAGFRMSYNGRAVVGEEGRPISFDQIKRDDPTAEEDDRRPRPRITTHLCYAASDDGFTWSKPEVGLFDVGGSKANNIVFPELLEGSVFADPACGFRIFSSMEAGEKAIWSAMRSASSADGDTGDNPPKLIIEYESP